MRVSTRYILISFLSLTILLSCSEEQNKTITEQEKNTEQQFRDVLNLNYDSTLDIPNLFFDEGSWHGYGLNTNKDLMGFYGPYSLTDKNGFEVSDVLSQFGIKELSSPIRSEQYSYPGRLTAKYEFEQLTIDLTLVFISNRSSMIEATITNTGSEQVDVSPFWKGNINDPYEYLQDGLFRTNNTYTAITSTPASIESSEGYLISYTPNQLSPSESRSYRICHSICFNPTEIEHELEIVDNALNNKDLIVDHILNWKSKTDQLTNGLSEQDQHLIIKCLTTLNNNWKSAAGELKHDGLFPAYSNRWFQGFWSWDSWKHAVAIAQYDTELAKNQIRTMYDYQNNQGMIVDCIFRDTIIEKHNWRDTKPPLSGWAIWEVYQQDHDLDFLKEMYPKLEKYHQFWYLYRDVDKNGLCEYGSTDGTLIAAKWESGMDNAVRFDSSQLLQSSAGAWSIDQESVDLNSYLYLEKIILYQIATEMALENAEQWKQEAEELKLTIQNKMYDSVSGWYYDIKLNSGEFIKTKGPEGWTPLWTGLATQEQAESIKNTIILEENFNTWVPFPTIEANHPQLDPFNGYWRGPVWIDQAFFAIEGLKRYGFDSEAIELQNKLLKNCEGLYDQSPIRENYHPITGEGLNATHFSWSAAHILLLLKP